MNTVDALKDLYKTLCGKDYAGDPNPTDAEMIKAIAKDASTGGSGSGGGESSPIVECHLRQEYDPETGTQKYFFTSMDEYYKASDPHDRQNAGVIFKVTESDDEYFIPYYFKAEGFGTYIWYFDALNTNCLVSSRYSIGSSQIYPTICWLTFDVQDDDKVELIINHKDLSAISI